MVTVEFLGPIGKAPMELDIKNLKELSDELNKDEQLKSWLANCAVAVNDTMVAALGQRVSPAPRRALT